MLTPAEHWELLALDERLKHARTLVQVAEEALQRAQARIAQAHGVDVSRPYRFLPDGTVENVEGGGEAP